MADRRYRIPETPVPGKPLGRHVNHDARSLLFTVAPTDTPKSASWKRTLPILDQGQVGSCTGNAGTGWLGTAPNPAAAVADLGLNEAYAVALYGDATRIDDVDGSYPPDDTGSDGLSIGKVLVGRKLASGYRHITSLAAAQNAIQTGPFIIGVNWYEGFDSPDGHGVVTVSGSVRGGHEVEVIGYDAGKKLWHAANSWGPDYGVDGTFFFSDATFTRLLAEQGDGTVLVPTSEPAPTPTPAPSVWPAAILDPWLMQRHTGQTRQVVAALIALRTELAAQQAAAVEEPAAEQPEPEAPHRTRGRRKTAEKPEDKPTE